MDKGYSFARVSHDSNDPKKDNDKLKLSYLITALRESVLWGFAPNNLKVLIIDDRLYDSEDNKNKIKDDIVGLLKICNKLSIECYGLFKSNKIKFSESIKRIIDGLNFPIEKIILEKTRSDFTTVCYGFNKLSFFDYLLVDLWYKDTESIRGLGLISELHHKLQEIARKGILSFKKADKDKLTASEEKLPEILAYSVSDDAETIQMAHRMGAAGYAPKKIPESLILAIVRAGLPLGQREATLFDFLISNNFPIIANVPRQITKNLFSSDIAGPDRNGQVKNNSHLEWLRKIPKSDLHVHFGTAIPIKWCYILSLISLIHWNDYWKCINRKSKYKKKILPVIKDIVNRLSRVIAETLSKPNTGGFRRTLLRKFSEEFKIAEVVFLKDVIAYLTKIHSGMLTEKQIACLINVLLGNIIFDENKWKELYKNAYERIKCLKDEVKKEKTQIHNLKLFRDCRYLIDSINLPKELPELDFLKLEKLNGATVEFDPLSEMLATDMVEHPYGLERYLAASDMVGSSLLQFTDTLLLASMSIPEWAAALKANNENENGDKKKSEPNEKYKNRDNVIHIELRATPQGFLRPYDFDMQDRTLAAKLICAGLEFGIKKLLKKPDSVSANLLLSIKRDRDRSSIMNLISIAVDMRDEYMRYLEINNKDISEVEGYMIPHVSGLDVAGIERNNLPADLQPYYREAFERCLLSTIHAGETESARSVRDAIFMLSASRIGHGLSIKKDAELKRMISDRGICVELCPKSNQFTNGFPVFSKQKEDTKKEDKDKNNSPYEYVYTDFRGKLIMSINTDNPTISHKTVNHLTFAYPLSEEFIWLAGMINEPLSRLEALHLIYNGFTSMFAPELAKKYIIGLADDEILSLLAEEYLDIDMRIGSEK
ncbi:MAG: hypothetical protein HY279_09455 [Nitrospinae bacterium]|nr:hypothetical protein [Nitrospinota bacterium]